MDIPGSSEADDIYESEVEEAEEIDPKYASIGKVTSDSENRSPADDSDSCGEFQNASRLPKATWLCEASLVKFLSLNLDE